MRTNKESNVQHNGNEQYFIQNSFREMKKSMTSKRMYIFFNFNSCIHTSELHTHGIILKYYRQQTCLSYSFKCLWMKSYLTDKTQYNAHVNSYFQLKLRTIWSTLCIAYYSCIYEYEYIFASPQSLMVKCVPSVSSKSSLCALTYPGILILVCRSAH